jgi:glucose/arabinose dehydrogenase
MICLAASAVAAATLLTPTVTRPGYSIRLVSASVPATVITQMTFKPGDLDHLYALQESGNVLRYDYNRVTGDLSNALVLASGLSQALGLGFHGDDLFVTMDKGGSRTVRPGDGRITRLSSPNAAGVFQVRHDFVHSINKGDHDINQIVIVGDTLYTGIGGVGRKGDPAEENIYTLTIARIANLNAIDWSGPIGADFKGPVNYLASPAEWINTTPADGYLRYYASGFRNPFGIAADADGDIWISTNGNSDVGFLSPDEVYRKVPLHGQGTFPPPSWGFTTYITGDPITPFSNLGQSPSPTGLDFVPGGPDAGYPVVAEEGASNQAQYPVGKDVILLDPVTGSFQILVDDMNLPTDVQRDPFGRLLISDYSDGSIWLLTPPRSLVGTVPGGGADALSVAKAGANLTLTWTASCAPADSDYEVYEGALGDFTSHAPRACSTLGATTATLTPSSENRYYLVVPRDAFSEGSYGRRGNGAERPQAAGACRPQVAGACF